MIADLVAQVGGDEVDAPGRTFHHELRVQLCGWWWISADEEAGGERF